MSTPTAGRQEREVQRYLKRAGVPYELRRRKKHIQVFVGGVCVACISYGNPRNGRRGLKNVYAVIDRRVRELNGK